MAQPLSLAEAATPWRRWRSLVYAEPGYQTANVSVDDFRIVRDNLAGGNRNTIDRLIPHLMSTDLPLGRVGLSESEARHQGIQVSERCLD
jgi:pyruvate/2-oxoglutarate dehydrogenase complex dihydrolipoamide dehydrogenase (E3) component